MPFGHLTIAFDDQVLRPRSWTTLQSAWAAELLQPAEPGRVLEVCAGAGQIGLLAVAGSGRHLVLVDLSRTACAFAHANASAAGLTTTVDVRCGRMDEVLEADERFAVIIADPPWVPSAEIGRFPEDPELSIDGGADGLSVTRTCLEVIGQHLSEDGSAVLQVGSVAQAAAVADHVAAHPDLRLSAVEQRAHADRGVLVHLTRPKARPAAV